MHPGDQPEDSKRSGITEDDAECLQLLLYLHERFSCGREPPTDISEVDLLQAVEDYQTFTLVAGPANEDASSGTEGYSEPSTHEESGGMQLCQWVDELTKTICHHSIQAGRDPMLFHLNMEHYIRGSEKDEIECRFFLSGHTRVCGKKFQRRNIPRHIASHLHERFYCVHLGCGKDFSRSDLRNDHVRKVHQVTVNPT